MSEEEIEIDNEESKETRKFPLKWVIIGLVAVLFIGGGVFGWMKVKKNSDDPVPKKSSVSTPVKPKPGRTVDVSPAGHMYSMESFIVNLNNPGGKRFLKTTIDLELTREEVIPDLKARLPQLRDVIILFLSEKSVNDIQGIDGKIVLKNNLITRINSVMGKGKIRNIYFTEFIIQ